MTPRSGGSVLRVMRLATRPQSMIFLWLVGFQDRCGRGVPTIRRSPASLMGFSSKSVGANSLDGTRSRSETLGDARRERSSLLHDHRGRRGAGDDWRGPALLAVGGAVVRTRRATSAGRPVRGTGALSRRRGARPTSRRRRQWPSPQTPAWVPLALGPCPFNSINNCSAARACRQVALDRAQPPTRPVPETNARLVLAPLQND